MFGDANQHATCIKMQDTQNFDAGQVNSHVQNLSHNNSGGQHEPEPHHVHNG